MFTGFTEETFAFFMAIKYNNNREFFLENRDWYLRAVREPALALAEEIAPVVEALDDTLERRPTKVVSRINRDVRFSNDKSPYRDYIWLAFRRPGVERKSTLGVFFDLGAEGASFGMGFYDENRALMNSLRFELLRDEKPFLRTWNKAKKEFTLHQKSFKRMKIPDTLSDAAREWYNLKGFYIVKDLSNELVLSHELVDVIRDGYKLLTPMYQYINRLIPLEEMPDET